MAPHQRVLPELDELNRAFWTGGAEGRLNIMRCQQCLHYIHPPAPCCPCCMSRAVVPQPVSGTGTVLTFTINYHPWTPDMAVPFAVAIVELDEQPGLRLTTNIVDCPMDQVSIGMRVQVTFVQSEDVWLPLFEQVGGSK